MIVNLFATNKTIDGVEISAEITIKNKIDATLQFDIFASRCSMDMKDCFKFSTTPPFGNLCSMFVEKGAYYTKIFENIKPEWKCPLQPGNYTMRKTFIDLSVVSFLPLDGSIWMTTFKILDEKSKKVIMCINSETKIVRKRVRD